MKPAAALIICLAITAVNVYATEQEPDSISYNGALYYLITPFPNQYLPLEILWKGSANTRPTLTIGPKGLMSSSCWRGYIAHWAVEDGNLYLTGLDAWLNDRKADLNTLFPDRCMDNRVKADWFSGSLVLTVKDGVTDNKSITLLFDNGRLILNKAGEMHLYITNESPNDNPVNIEVSLDGKVIFDKEIPYTGGDNVERVSIAVYPGTHTLSVRSKDTNVSAAAEFEAKEGALNWFNISYWYYTEKDLYGPVPRKFEIQAKDGPVMID